MSDHLDWYASGYARGLEDGRRQLEDEWRGRHEVSAAVARMIAGATPYADLCEQRGEYGRAEQQRALLRDRGVTA